MAKPSRRADEVRAALRRMAAISVFVLALTLTSPPALAPTDREPLAAPTAVAFDTDPLLGPWAVEQFLAHYQVAQDFSVTQQGGPAATPTAAPPAAAVRTVMLVLRARVAAVTVWKVVRQGGNAIRLGAVWVHRMTLTSWPDDAIDQMPLPAPPPVLDALPALAPDGFQDILNCGGVGPLRCGPNQPVVRADAGGFRASWTPASEAAARR